MALSNRTRFEKEKPMDEEKKPYKNPLAGLGLAEVQILLKEKLSAMPHGYKLPYMQWYEDDFKSSDGVEEMAPIERLMYRQLLAKAWSSKEAPYLPSDKERLFRLSDCPDQETWKKHGGAVLTMFVKTKDKKRLFHPRQLLDYASQIIRIAANTMNGKKGGRPAKSKETNDDQETQTETHSKPEQNPTKRQSEPEPETKSASKSKPETQATFEEDEPLFLETDGQDMKLEHEYGILCNTYFSQKPNLRGWAGEEIKRLGIIHKGSSVLRAFNEWCQNNQGNPDVQDPIKSFLREADDILSGDSPAALTAKDPEVVSLVRELTHISDGQVNFIDKQRVRLSEVLKEFSAEEIKSAFKTWLGDQDLSDPKNVSYLPGKFVQIVDGLCYSAKIRKQESDIAKTARDAAVLRLQAEAEEERVEREKKRIEEEEIFDPLANL